jgi:hypothetical protein
MPKTPPIPKTIASFTHTQDKRRNIPSAEYQTMLDADAKKSDEKLEQMIITFRELNPDYKEFVLHFIDQLLKLQGKGPRH